MTTATGPTPLPSEALDLFSAWLRGFAQAPDFEGRLAQAFGAGLDPAAVGGLRAAWADGSFALPRVELAGAEVLGGARGAYAADLGTIFLDSDFASRQPAEVLAALLLEEYGHAVDHALNGASDSPGDEGRIFARVVAGPALSAAELDALRVETDAATIEIAGAPVAVEQNGTVAVTYASNRHTFSINDVLGGFDGRTYAQDPTIIDLDGTPGIPTLTDKNGDVLSPIDSEFGFYVQDFIGATDKVRDFDYAEGWAGNILDANGFVVGLATVNAVTDTFKSGQPFGTWAAGLGGNSVKAETEHYEVMAYLLSDQEYPNDPNADYALDNGLTVRGGTYDGWTVEDVLAVVGDANGDGVEDIKDVLLPNESTTSENIAYGDDYSVTLKDDGKLLYRWGTEVKRPNDIRMDVKLTLPEEWLITTDLNGNGTADVFEVNGGLGYQVTRAELVVAHNITNNPNDQIRPEDWENEGATGRTPGYFIVTDPDDPTNTLWVAPVDSYAGSGEFLPSYFRLTATGEIDLVAQAGDVAVFHPDGTLAGYRNTDVDGNLVGTVYRDFSRIAQNDAANLVFSSSDLEEGFTNAWYTTTDRDPFEWSYDKFAGTDGANEYKQVYEGFRSAEEAEAAGYTAAELVSGPRWRLTSNKFGQDVPGVEIPLIDNSRPPYQSNNIKYDTGEPIITTINLLDWADDNGDGIDNDSPLLFSNGWVLIDPARMDVDLDGLIDEGWQKVNGLFNAGDAVPTGPIFSAVTPNGLTLTPDFLDTAFYLKGDRQDSAKIFNVQLVLEFEADPAFAPGYDYAASSEGDGIFTVDPDAILPVLGSGSGGGGQPEPAEPDIDQPLNQAPQYRVTHVFSTADVTGTFGGLTQGDVLPGETPVIDFTATPRVTRDGVELYPINSEFGFLVTDFQGSVPKDFVLNPEYAEGWAGDLKDAQGNQLGIVVSDSPTDTFKTPALLGTWLVGMGGDAVKADSEHYVVMQSILSDQRYPGDPDALYPLDDNLMVIGGVFDGQYVADIIANGLVDDVNGDGSIDIRDVLAPNESTIEENIAVSNDYSVTLKDDGKLLYRWGNEIKRPNDIRMEVELPLPDEWKTPDPATPDLLPLFRVTQAELVVRHTLTNNPNDQIRPEDYENEAAIGTLPEYLVQTVDVGTPDEREVWVTAADYYAGDGTLYPAGTVLKDPALAAAAQGTLLDQIGALSEDLLEGYTNAWYTTMNREPFEPVLDPVSGDYEVGPRWRLKADKYGQDLPGVVIPEDPTQPPPPTQDEVKYEVGAETQTVINLLDWEGISPLSISAGWTNAAGTVSGNGLNRTENFDIAFYVKGDQKPVTLYSAELVMDYEEVPIADFGDTVTGSAGDDVLAGLGGNTFTGLSGEDLFVVAYGTLVNADIVASVVTDFEVGVDKVGLIGLDVNELNFAFTVSQTVVGDDLQIALDGFLTVTLEGVTAPLTIDDFMVLTTQFSFVGTSGDDRLIGDGLPNEMFGLDGNDTILGWAGNDTIDGGTGDDLLYGLAGDDLILGGDGNDVLVGGAGNDTYFGGAGNDTFYITDAGDLIADAGAGFDVALITTPNLAVNAGSWVGIEQINGTSGSELIDATGLATAVAIYGGVGNDTLIGGEGDDKLFGAAGNDVLIGGGGNDTLAGQFGADTYFGGDGDDFILVVDALDVVADAGAGRDVAIIQTAGLSFSVAGWANLEQVNGSAGNDVIDATGLATGIVIAAAAGNDTITGGDGADQLYGGFGDDVLNGGAGADVLIGREGSDVLNGGAGNDFISGGSEADLFLFTAGFGVDRISDFEDGIDQIAFIGVPTVADFTDLVVTQSGANALITLASGGTGQVTLLNALAANIDASDFIFA